MPMRAAWRILDDANFGHLPATRKSFWPPGEPKIRVPGDPSSWQPEMRNRHTVTNGGSADELPTRISKISHGRRDTAIEFLSLSGRPARSTVFKEVTLSEVSEESKRLKKEFAEILPKFEDWAVKLENTGQKTLDDLEKVQVTVDDTLNRYDRMVHQITSGPSAQMPKPPGMPRPHKGLVQKVIDIQEALKELGFGQNATSKASNGSAKKTGDEKTVGGADTAVVDGQTNGGNVASSSGDGADGNSKASSSTAQQGVGNGNGGIQAGGGQAVGGAVTASDGENDANNGGGDDDGVSEVANMEMQKKGLEKDEVRVKKAVEALVGGGPRPGICMENAGESGYDLCGHTCDQVVGDEMKLHKSKLDDVRALTWNQGCGERGDVEPPKGCDLSARLDEMCPNQVEKKQEELMKKLTSELK